MYGYANQKQPNWILQSYRETILAKGIFWFFMAGPFFWLKLILDNARDFFGLFLC